MPRSRPSGHIAFFAGTRPEQIKLLPVYRPLTAEKVFYVLGQQKDLLTYERWMKPIALRRKTGTLDELVALELMELEKLPWDEIAIAVVQGDTTTALAAALSAFHHQVPVAHVEAGLRSGRRYVPFPEEKNRQLIAQLATHHFAPSDRARFALSQEGVGGFVHVVGQTGIDAFYAALEAPVTDRLDNLAQWINGRKTILVTYHRRENATKANQLMSALRSLPDDLAVVWPQHPARQIARFHTMTMGNVWAGPAFTHSEMARLVQWADVVVTDSGGLSEEACEAEKPCIILRSRTERWDVLDDGCWLYDDSYKALPGQITKALAWSANWRRNSKGRLGDGLSGPRIAKLLEKAWRRPFDVDYDFDG